MNFRVGHAQDLSKATGCTVVIFPEGAVASCDVRGGAPATRETDLLDPSCLVDKIDAILLAGGSAFGLAAADGVMSWCLEHNMGFDTGFGLVPIVLASCIFDFSVGEKLSWPDREMGIEACRNAQDPFKLPMGNWGAGTGATVGKYLGLHRAMKSGVGWHVTRKGKVKVYALAVVNSFGGVVDQNGALLAGALNDAGHLVPCNNFGEEDKSSLLWGQNTTLSVIVTNAKLSKADCKRVSIMAHDGMARAISPVHTPFDGDVVFCASTGGENSSVLDVGIMAAEALSEAIRNGVKFAQSAYGFKGNSLADVD
ncbi:MAG: hypothetical protein PWP05_987 [Thermovirga sp.]|nr:hypothetical protein [Thermovirga sp.]